MAILPPRLKEEVEQVAAYLVGEDVLVADYHQEWADELKESNPDLKDKIQALEIVQESVGKIFCSSFGRCRSLQANRRRTSCLYALCKSCWTYAIVSGPSSCILV